MPILSHSLSAAALLSLLLPSAGSPWNGTWTLNKATLYAIPPPLVIQKTGTHYSLTQGTTYHFDCDGRDYPGPDSGELRCAELPHGIKVEQTRDGKLRSRWKLELHQDGISMNETETDVFPGVPPSVAHDEYRRYGHGSKSLVGSWKGVRTTFEGGDALELRIHDGFLYFHDARDGETSDAKLDGTPSPFLGTDAPAGIAWSNVLENGRRIVGHALKDGKPLNTEVFELSADGKSIKVSQPDSATRFEAIYEKQSH